MFVNGKDFLKIKADNKNVNFPIQFCLGSVSSATEKSLNGNVNNVSVNYDSVDKFDRLNFHEYLMNRNNVKYCLVLLNITKALLFCYIIEF